MKNEKIYYKSIIFFIFTDLIFIINIDNKFKMLLLLIIINNHNIKLISTNLVRSFVITFNKLVYIQETENSHFSGVTIIKNKFLLYLYFSFIQFKID